MVPRWGESPSEAYLRGLVEGRLAAVDQRLVAPIVYEDAPLWKYFINRVQLNPPAWAKSPAVCVNGGPGGGVFVGWWDGSVAEAEVGGQKLFPHFGLQLRVEEEQCPARSRWRVIGATLAQDMQLLDSHAKGTPRDEPEWFDELV